jgi:hypothetical protein
MRQKMESRAKDACSSFSARRSYIPPKPVWAPQETVEPDGYVYIVKAAGRVKIGFSTDPVQRFSEINTGCPFPVQVLLIMRGKRSDEQQLHHRFHRSRRHNEWFDPSPALLRFIEKAGPSIEPVKLVKPERPRIEL